MFRPPFHAARPLCLESLTAVGSTRHDSATTSMSNYTVQISFKDTQACSRCLSIAQAGLDVQGVKGVIVKPSLRQSSGLPVWLIDYLLSFLELDVIDHQLQFLEVRDAFTVLLGTLEQLEYHRQCRCPGSISIFGCTWCSGEPCFVDSAVWLVRLRIDLAQRCPEPHGTIAHS